jgi:3-methyl-2-oxobutanoate hydroxymethyltransferase
MRVTIPKLHERARAGEKLAMLTCYDASFAATSDAAGVDILLVGDSLGMVIQGHDSTLPAARLVAAGAQMVKLEGGATMVETTRFLVERGVPVCAHIGLTPQSVNTLGGYRVQGKSEDAADRLVADAKALEAAGAAIVLMEAMPAAVAKRVTDALTVPTIGIGAGVDVGGQVLVVYDMLDIYPGRKARFVKNFMAGQSSVKAAIEAYVREVKARTFPGPEHCF